MIVGTASHIDHGKTTLVRALTGADTDRLPQKKQRDISIGITALGIKMSGEIYMCRAKPVGSLVEQGRAIGVVELAKAIVSVKSAVAGTGVAVNAQLDAAPELVHLDPYGAGWIARLALRALGADLPNLVSGDDVYEAMVRHADRVAGDEGGLLR